MKNRYIIVIQDGDVHVAGTDDDAEIIVIDRRCMTSPDTPVFINRGPVECVIPFDDIEEEIERYATSV